MAESGGMDTDELHGLVATARHYEQIGRRAQAITRYIPTEFIEQALSHPDDEPLPELLAHLEGQLDRSISLAEDHHLIAAPWWQYPPGWLLLSKVAGLARWTIAEIESAQRLARGLPALISDASVPPERGVFGAIKRLLEPEKTARTEEAQQLLRTLVGDPAVAALYQRVADHLPELEGALAQEGAFDAFNPAPLGYPYRELGENIIVRTLHSQLEKDEARAEYPQEKAGTTAADSEIAFIDREQLWQLMPALRTVEHHPDSLPNLRAEAQSALDQLRQERAEIILRQLPVDLLKEVTADRIRTQGLESIGVYSAQDVLNTKAQELARVTGIGEKTARRLRAAAYTMRNEALGGGTRAHSLLTQAQQQEVGQGEDPPLPTEDMQQALEAARIQASSQIAIGANPTPAAVALVGVLGRYAPYEEQDEPYRERRTRLTDALIPLIKQLPEVAGVPTNPYSRNPYRNPYRSAPANNPTATPFNTPECAIIGPDAKAYCTQLEDDMRWAIANPSLLDPAASEGLGRDQGRITLNYQLGRWEDYLERPAYYQGLLSQLLSYDNTRGVEAHLSKEILEAIRNTPLDRSLLHDLSLRGYQSFAARYGIVQRKVLIGDEMGLGKTVEAIAIAAHLHATSSEDFHTLVICPASVLINWAREIENFSYLKVHRAHGSNKEAALKDWARSGGVCICTFDGSRVLTLGQPDLVIIDEAHYIKNPDAKRSQAAAKLIKAARYAVLMTGTPLENRLEEFNTLLGYLNSAVLPRNPEAISSDRYRELIAPVYLRRTQNDVLDELPAMQFTQDFVELSDEEERLYRQAVAEGNWMGMRQACLGIGASGTSAKMTRLVEIVESARAEDRKVVVFSYFLGALELAAWAVPDELLVGTISGKVSPKDRQQMVDDLGSAPAGAVLLSQITAGGVGLNIQAASVVVILEPQITPSKESQAIARSRRMGQLHTVDVHYVVAEDTVDERIIEILNTKRKIFADYAQESIMAAADDAVDISEISLAAEVIAQERQRLGYTHSGDKEEGAAPRTQETPGNPQPSVREAGLE